MTSEHLHPLRICLPVKEDDEAASRLMAELRSSDVITGSSPGNATTVTCMSVR